MQAKKEEITLKKACEKFAEGRLKLDTEKVTALFAIFGHSNAGKTIAADLLEGKSIELINDIEKGAVLVR